MKWINRNDDQSNYEDRRGSSGRKVAIGGIGTIVVFVIALLLKQDPQQLLNTVNQVIPSGGSEQIDETASKENEDLKVFSLGVFNSANDVWTKIFEEQLKKEYRNPTFVTFTDQTESGCGGANASSGPFYCPADEKVYIDLSFFHELANRFHAPGDLAMAYVTAHEVGHHIQKLLGYTDYMQKQRGQVSETEYNELSVRLELQADFYAGIWARHAEEMNIIQLEEGDIESAMNAANAVGDDNLQKQMQGYVVPESFTHGTSEQRMRWFNKGYNTGDMRKGNTFEVEQL
jgi:predicted metalloprotease